MRIFEDLLAEFGEEGEEGCCGFWLGGARGKGVLLRRHFLRWVGENGLEDLVGSFDLGCRVRNSGGIENRDR